MTRLRPMRTGTVAMPRAYMFRGEIGVSMVDSPLGAFLVEHPTEGPVLVDTGIDAPFNFGRILGVVARGLKMAPEEAVAARLKGWGIAPEDVRTVVMTHLHFDHTSAMARFPSATFVTTRAEWDAAHARLSILRGYVASHLPAESAMHFVDFSGGDVDLFGDGSVRLISTPGHTPGHLSVLVAADEGPVLLLGDAVYTLRSLREDILPLITADDDAARESMRSLRAYAEAQPETTLIPTHDAEVWAGLDGGA